MSRPTDFEINEAITGVLLNPTINLAKIRAHILSQEFKPDGHVLPQKKPQPSELRHTFRLMKGLNVSLITILT